MLQFLTGDIWQISFVQKDEKSCSEKSEEERSSAYEQVSLFSGGMDSLIYVLDSLESGREKMLLISHANDSTIKNKRTDVLKGVVDFYKDRSVITSVDLWTKFKGNCLESFDENSTRSRSFLFIALGLFVMSGTSNLKTLFVPENGFIAMNVPLEAVRVGSHSTRTTHPFYFDGWNKILASLGFDMAIENPYWAKTKGEMVQECKNKSLLKTLLDTAISCSSPSKSRWKGKSAQHCGYCYPCLIRRAALHSAGVIDSTRYLEESLSIMRDQRDGASSINLRSIEYQLSKLPKGVELTTAYILKTGPLLQNEEYLAQLAQVYQRGMQELHNFIRSF
jgi:7-cyano-7-deazaguanine synthase in queuosine biosynthesis